MAYEVKLDVFEGPLDLLLNLITRQRVDIYDVPLAAITDEYLAAISRMDHLDLEATTGFLVVAATLIELKSLRLLPTRGEGDLDPLLLEERDLLLARLAECATFREAGMWIKSGLELGASWHGRSVALEEPFVDLAPDLLARTSVDDLAAAAAHVLAPVPMPPLDTSHVAPIRASVRDAVLLLAERLKGASASFEELCGDAGERMEVIVRFLALLELFKAGAVEIVQATRFGDITATWTGEATAEDVLLEAEEYALDAGRER
ncbi:MAG: segregation and condensation protein A [Actinomycetota bacterium]